jgi:hypothetical protein
VTLSESGDGAADNGESDPERAGVWSVRLFKRSRAGQDSGDDQSMSANDLLRYFSVPGWPNVYVLGCLERRVTIHDQQVRAANLVWALHASDTVRRGEEVGIVGGGFAGVTAAVAASYLGMKPVLFEASSGVCATQAASSRWIHPRLYDWPEDGWDREHSLEFMSWDGGEARSVVKKLRHEWSASGGTAHVQTDVDSIEPGEERVLIRTSPLEPGAGLPPPLGPHEFRAVIVAVGFGKEKDEATYWADTDLEEIATRQSWAVGGLGDGALIEAARLRLKRQGKSFFALLTEIANQTPAHVRQQLVRLERLAQRLERSHVVPQAGLIDDEAVRRELVQNTDVSADAVRNALRSGRSHSIHARRTAINRRDRAVAEVLHEGLRRILRNDEQLTELREIVGTTRRNDTRVILVGPSPYPFNRSASLLNRWTIALLTEYDREDARCGFAFSEGHLKDDPSRVVHSEGERLLRDYRCVRRFGSTRPLRAENDEYKWCEDLFHALTLGEEPLTSGLDTARKPHWPGDAFTRKPAQTGSGVPEPGSEEKEPRSRPETFRYYFATEAGATAVLPELAQAEGVSGFGLYLVEEPRTVGQATDADQRARDRATRLFLSRARPVPGSIAILRVDSPRRLDPVNGADGEIHEAFTTDFDDLAVTRLADVDPTRGHGND